MQFTGVEGFDAAVGRAVGQYRILRGKIDMATLRWVEGRVLHPPSPTPCEKNWIHTPVPGQYIYGWHPLTLIGEVDGSSGSTKVIRTFETPYLWSHFRGSSSAVRWGDHLWAVVHFKYDRDGAMAYVHCVVKLDGETLKPAGYSQPFVFAKLNDVEFCLGMDISWSGQMTFFFSSRDRNPGRITVGMTSLHWHKI